MPVYIPDEIAPFLKVRLLGVIFAAVAYGIVIVLSGNCFRLLQNKRSIYSHRMQILLLIYIMVMFLLSTWALIQSILQFMKFISLRDVLPRYLRFLSIAIPPVIWGADGFMVRILIFHQEQRFTVQLQVWRCVVLYQDISRLSRVVIIVLLSFISLASFGRSIPISIQPN
jgi:hypothetical protein